MKGAIYKHAIFRLFILMALCGCAQAVKYSDTPPLVDISVLGAQASKTRVLANADEWRSSGVVARRGNSYLIDATGSWRLWNHFRWTSPDGDIENFNYGGISGKFVSDYPTDALIMKIGETGNPIGVGKSRSIIADRDGILYFRMNQNSASTFIGEAKGQVDVIVTYIKSNPPAQDLAPSVVYAEKYTEPAQKLEQKDKSKLFAAEQKKVTVYQKTKTDRRLALVIGNSAYRISPLKNPVNDAQDIAAALRRVGFDVTIVRDATQQQMENAVREFGLKLRQGGTGLFYYAGHGVQVAGENYLVPVNAVIQTEGDVKFSCLPAGLVLAKMEDAGNDVNIVILDACRNNSFSRSFRNAEQGLAKMDAPTGSLISYATAPGSVASDGAGRNGLFTQHLLKNIATPGLPITEVFMRVRQGVVQETKKKQVPWESSSLIGQFYFSE